MARTESETEPKIRMIRGWNNHAKGKVIDTFAPGLMHTLVENGYAIFVGSNDDKNNLQSNQRTDNRTSDSGRDQGVSQGDRMRLRRSDQPNAGRGSKAG